MTRRSVSPAIVVFVALAAVTTLPWARAALDPPPGRAFLGVLFQVEDIYNYFGFVQQAEDGAFLFHNKLVTTPHAAALVNLEWWATGVLSRVLGRDPALAFRLLGLAAAAALVVGVDRLLVFAGLPASHRLPALLWVFFAGGLGGLRYAMAGLAPWRSLDLIAGLFPFIEVLVNPHFVCGTALLVWTLLAFERVPGSGGPWSAALFGSVLALSRPYDAALALTIAGLSVAFTRPPRRWVPEMAPLLPVLAPMAFTAWVLYRVPAFGVFSSVGYTFPPLSDVAVALGPAAAVALAGVLLARRLGLARARVLIAWAALGIALAVFHPLAITLQFLVGIGIPLVALGALGFARWRPAVTVLAAVLFASTAAVALSIVMKDNPRWMAPAERVAAARALQPACRPGDVALTPPDIGLYALAHASCRPFLAHVAAGDFEERDALARRFYGPEAPAWRAGFLDERCVAHVVLGGDQGEVPAAWLGAETDFRRTALVGGGAIAVYSRPRPARCR